MHKKYIWRILTRPKFSLFSKSLFNPTGSGVFGAVREVGGGANWPPNYFRCLKPEGAVIPV